MKLAPAQVSACHYLELKNNESCNATEYLRSHLRYTASWTNLRFDIYSSLQALLPDRFFTVYFRDLKEAFRSTVGLLASRLGFPLLEESLAVVESKTSVERLQKKEAKGNLPGNKKDKVKVRRGAACNFLREVDPPTAAWAGRVLQTHLSPELRRRFSCPELGGSSGV